MKIKAPFKQENVAPKIVKELSFIDNSTFWFSLSTSSLPYAKILSIALVKPSLHPVISSFIPIARIPKFNSWSPFLFSNFNFYSLLHIRT